MIITKTPYRVSFFGGGTDYPEWYSQHGGEILSTAINYYSYVTCRYLPGFYSNKYRIAYRKVENTTRVDEIEHPVIRAALKYLGIKEGLSIHHDGDLPACCGMGSSSAFTVGLLAALYAYKGLYYSPSELARDAIYLEQKLLQECVGIQDQIACSYGGFNHIKISSDGSFKVLPVICSTEKLRQLQENLILIYTGQSRFASDIAASQVVNFDKKQQQLKVMQDLVAEALSILRSSKDNLDEFGQLLDESWHYKRELSNKVTNEIIDDLYDSAKQAGALGGKLLGAGGGGFLMFYVPNNIQDDFFKLIKKGLIVVKLLFSWSKSEVAYFSKENLKNGVHTTLRDFVEV